MRNESDPATLTYRLLIRPAPDPRESLAGYLLRLADMNCLRHAQELLEFLGIRAKGNFQPSQTPQFGVYSLDRLSKELGHPAESFAGIARPLDVRFGKYRKFGYRGTLWPVDLIRDKHRAWCPLCLKEETILPSSWDWRVMTTCDRHRVFLVDRCPACQKAVSWRDSLLRHCACGFLLSEAPSEPAPDTWSPIVIEALSALELERYHALVLLSLDGSSLDTSQLRFCSASQLLEATMGISPQVLRSNAAFKRAVVERIQKRYDVHPKLGPRFAVAGALRGRRINPKFDEELAATANQWLQRGVSGTIPLNTIGPAPALSIDTVATVLNVSAHIVRMLLRKQVLTYVDREIRTGRKRIDKQAVVDGAGLERLLLQLVTTSPSSTVGKHIEFDHFGIDYANRLDLLLDLSEKLVQVERFNPAIGLPSLVMTLNHTATTNPHLLSVHQAAEFLDIYPDAIYQLIKTQHLKPHSIYKQKTYIDISQLTTFQENYIFVRELARQLGCNATNLADRLISIGVQPMHGPTVDGGLIYAFRRTDLTEELLQNLIGAENYKSRCGRGKHRFIQSEGGEWLLAKETCKALKVQPHQLTSICKEGFLHPIQVDGKPFATYFSKEEVEIYCKLYKYNPELISLKDAQACCKKVGVDFYRKIKNSGLISIITDGLSEYCNKAQLSQACIVLSESLTTKHLSEKTGISPIRIRFEAKNGCLKDCLIYPECDGHGFLFSQEAINILNNASKRRGWARVTCQ